MKLDQIEKTEQLLKDRTKLKDNIEDLDYHNRKVLWTYEDCSKNLEFNEVSMKIEWSKIKNRVIVIGSNINGLLCKGVAENKNPASAYNVNGNFGVHPLIINDNLINSPSLCEDRAIYELKKNAMKYISVQLKSIYIPHLGNNDLIRWTFEDYNYYNQIFAIQSISIPLKPQDLPALTFTNLQDLPL